jgi:hypothetical protein
MHILRISHAYSDQSFLGLLEVLASIQEINAGVACKEELFVLIGAVSQLFL